MRGQLTGREWLGRVGGAPTTAEPRIGWGARCGNRGCGLGDRSTTQPQVVFCDQSAAPHAGDLSKRSVHRLPDGHVLEHARPYLPLSSGHRLGRYRVSPGWICRDGLLIARRFARECECMQTEETFRSTTIPVGRKTSEAAQDGSEADGPAGPRVCIVGASGKLGRYMVQHALDRGYQVVAVCREVSVDKLEEFSGRITIIPGATDDRHVIERAVAGCDGVLTVLVPRGVHDYSSGTAQAVLDLARPGARLVFSCGYHITRDGQDVYSWKVKALVNAVGRLARLVRMVDLDDQVEACRRVFASDTRWTVVRGSDLEEGEPQGLPVWSRHVGDPILQSNLTRRVDFARFMVEALENDELVREAPAIVGCQTPSALAHITNSSPALR